MSSAVPEDDALNAMLAPMLRGDRGARLLAAALFGAGAGLGMAAGLRFFDWYADFILASVIAGCAVALGVGVLFWRGAPEVWELALRVDLAYRTNERLVTALELGRGGGVVADALRADVAALAGRVSLRGIRTGAEPVLAAGIVLMLVSTLVFGVADVADRSEASEPVSQPPMASDISLLAREIALTEPLAPETTGTIVQGLERLAETMGSDGLSPSQAQELAGLLDDGVQAQGNGGQMMEGAGTQPTIMPGSIAQWAENDAITFGEGEMGQPRTFARPMLGLEMRPAAQEGEEIDRPQSVSPSAAAQIDDLPVEIDGPVSQTESRSEEGTSSFVPPNLIEGDPRAAQAIDLAGTGEAERQESMTATTGRGGALPDQPRALPSDSTRGQIMELTQIIPMEGQRVRYYIEPGNGGEAHEGVTLGTLPDWPALVPAPVRRGVVPAAAAPVVARYFDRAEDGLP